MMSREADVFGQNKKERKNTPIGYFIHFFVSLCFLCRCPHFCGLILPKD